MTAGSTDKTLKLYDGHFHDLLNDLGKEAVMADITRWIGRHLDQSATPVPRGEKTIHDASTAEASGPP